MHMDDASIEHVISRCGNIWDTSRKEINSLKYKIKYIFPSWDNYDYSAKYFLYLYYSSLSLESSSIFALNYTS